MRGFWRQKVSTERDEHDKKRGALDESLALGAFLELLLDPKGAGAVFFPLGLGAWSWRKKRSVNVYH